MIHARILLLCVESENLACHPMLVNNNLDVELAYYFWMTRLIHQVSCFYLIVSDRTLLMYMEMWWAKQI
ncbi:hypothetical protein HanRHA438_Chr03g0128351 [Helianthus annuus]|nr:hypothetical protein HanRHA438_Chr03g0128351 [Helianthus annuus]